MKRLSKIFGWFKRLGGSKLAKEKPSDLTIRERKEKERHEQEQLQKDLEKAREQATTWRNRAMMARQQNNEDLVKQALMMMWKYQAAAAKLQGKEPPPEPDDIPFDLGFGDEPGLDEQSGCDPPWRPYDPSRVPKKPLPSSGGSELALPEPDSNDE